MKRMYKELLEIPGAPSYESHVKKYLKDVLEPFAEEIVEDRLGSIFAGINTRSKGPRVVIAGHMDEVGAMVTGITKEGLVKMKALGGMKGDVFLSQHMVIYTDDLEEIPGVTASKPPHLTRGKKEEKPLTFDELRLDIGAESKEHAEELGVKLGQQIIPKNNFTVTADGKKFISKAWDDRFGCAMAVDILEEFKDEDIPCALYGGGTVQEEAGLRGAKTATYTLDPDIFIAVDCSPCQDSFGGDEISGKLNEGFLVRFHDPNQIMHRGMKRHIEELAAKHNIKYQHYHSKGGTDAARAQLSRRGVLVATIGMPARYIHSTTSMIHQNDYEAVRAMLKELVKTLDSDTVAEIKKNV